MHTVLAPGNNDIPTGILFFISDLNPGHRKQDGEDGLQREIIQRALSSSAIFGV